MANGEPLDQRQVTFDVQVPPDLEGGVYSNFVGVWHTAWEFTLDFAVLAPAVENDAGNTVVRCPVVSRVRIPVTVLFDLLKALNSNMTKYEDVFGEIKPPVPQAQTPQEGGSDEGSDDLGHDA